MSVMHGLTVEGAQAWTHASCELANEFVGHPLAAPAGLYGQFLEHAGQLTSQVRNARRENVGKISVMHGF